MIRAVLGVRHGVSAFICLMVALGVCSDSCAGDIDEAEQLFADHCAVCHGADRGGYIGPALVSQQPKRQVSWGLEDIRRSLEVYVADETSLPATPTYPIENLDDLMAVTARGSYSAGDVLKVDLYSLQVVRKVQAGLSGTSLAVSRDGRYVAAGSFVPNTVVILDAATLAPLRLLELQGLDPDGNLVASDASMITSPPYANYFVLALEQAGQIWLIDLAGKRIVKKIPAGCKPHLGCGDPGARPVTGHRNQYRRECL